MERNEALINKAIDNVIINTGFVDETNTQPFYYFAEAPELDIKCADITEEKSLRLLLIEIDSFFRDNLSVAKKIAKKKKIV